MSLNMETLFDLLQKDFCPPLDSSLIAALLVELESDAEGNTVSPSQDQIDNLYATCSALALQSEESQQSDFSESSILQASQISVKSKKKPSTKAEKKKIQSQSNKIILNDIRQQHHIRPSTPSTTRATDGSNIKRPTTTPDPWTQISSLSTHIASLLPPHPPSFFQSFFHSPIHTTSYDALRVALTSLCKNKQDPVNYTTIVSNIMEILSLNNGDVDPELKARRIADIRLSVTVADGRATEALDLVNVLRDLDTRPDMGLSHLLPAQVSNLNGVNPSDSTSQSQVMLKPPSPTFENKPKFSSRFANIPIEFNNLLLENNKDSIPDEIDLHGLCVKEAVTLANQSIQLAKSNRQSQVKLIVGKGRHSQGGIAKIKPAIEELIQEHKLVAQLDPNNSGVLIAYLDQ